MGIRCIGALSYSHSKIKIFKENLRNAVTNRPQAANYLALHHTHTGKTP
jgi:hypothetical protein